MCGIDLLVIKASIVLRVFYVCHSFATEQIKGHHHICSLSICVCTSYGHYGTGSYSIDCQSALKLCR